MTGQIAISKGTQPAPVVVDRRLWLTRTGFLLGAMGPSISFQIVIILMLRYMTDSLAISAVVAGSVLALTKVFDAVIDPVLGWASDKTRTPIGRRRPYFMLATILLPLSGVFLFNVPQMAAPLVVGWLAVFLVMNAAGYSAYTVPYIASVSEITDDYHERSVLMSFRVYGLTLGFMTASTGAPWLLALWGSGRAAHGHMGWVMAGLMLITSAIGVWLIPEPKHDGAAEPKMSFKRRASLVWANKPFRLIVVSHVGFQIGVGAVLVCTAYFTRQVLHLSDIWLGSFYLFKTIGNLVSVPLWFWLSKRFDKKAAYMASLIAYGLFNLSWLLAGPGEPPVLMFARMFLIGVAMGGCILLSASIITDAIRYDAVRTGTSQQGVFSGITTFVDKTFQSAGVALVGYLLSSMGYVSSTHGVHIQQPHSAMTAIYIGFSVMPALAAVVCIVAMSGYRLTERDFAAGAG
jgi:GPH family glycoside/pentoside/hexuronide:cation symporter